MNEQDSRLQKRMRLLEIGGAVATVMATTAVVLYVTGLYAPARDWLTVLILINLLLKWPESKLKEEQQKSQVTQKDSKSGRAMTILYACCTLILAVAFIYHVFLK